MVESSYLKSAVLFLLIFAIVYILRGVPAVLSFMLSGIVAKLFISEDELIHFEIFEKSAVFLLFFFIGLEFSFEKLKGMVNVWIPGFIEFILCFLLPLPLFVKLGYSFTSASLLSLIVYPTSSIVLVKMIADSRRAGFPETELLVGLLIFQDIVSIMILSFILPLYDLGRIDVAGIFFLFLKISLVFVIFIALFRYLPLRLFDNIAKNDSFIFFIWGIVLLVGFISEKFGVIPVLSTFLLGVLIPERSRIYDRVQREFSVFKELSVGLFFFFFTFKLNLSDVVLSIQSEVIALFIALVMVSVITKFVSTYIGGRLYGFKRAVSLRAALSFLMRGEFSVLTTTLVYDDVIKAAGAIYVFSSIIFGIVSFMLAPSISKFVKKL